MLTGDNEITSHSGDHQALPNVALVTWYPREKIDSMSLGWHTDLEREHGPPPWVYNLSLGADARLNVRTAHEGEVGIWMKDRGLTVFKRSHKHAVSDKGHGERASISLRKFNEPGLAGQTELTGSKRRRGKEGKGTNRKPGLQAIRGLRSQPSLKRRKKNTTNLPRKGDGHRAQDNCKK